MTKEEPNKPSMIYSLIDHLRICIMPSLRRMMYVALRNNLQLNVLRPCRARLSLQPSRTMRRASGKSSDRRWASQPKSVIHSPLPLFSMLNNLRLANNMPKSIFRASSERVLAYQKHSPTHDMLTGYEEA